MIVELKLGWESAERYEALALLLVTRLALNCILNDLEAKHFDINCFITIGVWFRIGLSPFAVIESANDGGMLLKQHNLEDDFLLFHVVVQRLDLNDLVPLIKSFDFDFVLLPSFLHIGHLVFSVRRLESVCVKVLVT